MQKRLIKNSQEEFQINLEDLIGSDFLQSTPLSIDSSPSFDTRTIWLNNEVYPETISPLLQNIVDINAQDDQESLRFQLQGQTYVRKPIKLYLNSYGGSLYDGLALVSLIQQSKTPVHTYTIGKVMSMGFLLSIVATKRYTYPHTTYMYHSLARQTSGKFASLVEGVEEAARLQNKVDVITLENTFIKKEQLENIHAKKLDWYFDAEDALALGCVDEIL